MTNKISDDGILQQFIHELGQKAELPNEEAHGTNTTKGEMLVKKMVNEALNGDQRMITSVLKFIEKIDALTASKKEEERKAVKPTEEDEDIILRYYGKHKKSIEKKLERRYKKDPNAWHFYAKHVGK